MTAVFFLVSLQLFNLHRGAAPVAYISIGWTNSDQPIRMCESSGKVENSKTGRSYWSGGSDWCTGAGPPCWHRPGGWEAAKAVLGSPEQKNQKTFFQNLKTGQFEDIQLQKNRTAQEEDGLLSERGL